MKQALGGYAGSRDHTPLNLPPARAPRLDPLGDRRGATEDAAMQRFAAAASPCSANPPQTNVQARGGVESLIYPARTASKAEAAASRSSRLCAADICVRIRALPCGTTGYVKLTA
jgi:hypothetical protein